MATVNVTKVCDCGKPKLEKFPTCKDCKDKATAGSTGNANVAPPKNAEPAKPIVEKKPEKFVIEPRLNGRDGLYDLDIQVIVFNGPSRAFDVKISEVVKMEWETILSKGRSYYDKTSDVGFLSIPLNPDGFTEERRKIVVQIVGTDIDYPIYLDGPKRKWSPTVGAGFWGRLSSLIKNIKDLNKSKRRYSR